MNKKGFTLVEIISVVTVLSLILIIAVPTLTKTLKRIEQNKYNEYIDNLKIITENYVVSKLKEGSFFEEGKDYNYVSLGNLIDAGYVNDIATNPENDKVLSRDTRIKIYKKTDGTYDYDVKEYYNTTDDYDKNNLVVHYDSVEYSANNVFKNLTTEADFDYSLGGQWTENGVFFPKGENSMPVVRLNNEYSAEQLTLSISLESLDELTDLNYHYIIYLNDSNNNVNNALFGFRKSIALFYYSGSNTVLGNDRKPLLKEKNYTLTYVQEDLTTRKLYINGELWSGKQNLSLNSINYNGFYLNRATRTNVYDLNVYNMLIYNRALSADEVRELYELDKERFGE